MRPTHEMGFTLIEMLIVLAIIGVMASVTVIGIGAASRGTSAESEARGLAERVRVAQDDALITGQPIALVWDEKSYDFQTWDKTSRHWKAGAVGGVDKRHDLPSGIRLSGETRAPIVLRSTPFSLGVEGGGAPWQVTTDGLNVAVMAAP